MLSCCKGKSKNRLDTILNQFQLSTETLVGLLDRMDAAMTRGLDSVFDYDIRMFPTFISSVPNSKEKGKFLSLDLGFRQLIISLVELRGKQISFAKPPKKQSFSAPADEPKRPSRPLPPYMHWSSHGMDSMKGSIAYESLEVDLPDEFKTYNGDQFFQYLVDRLKDFLSYSKKVPQGSITLGFNFPCPFRPTGPASGILTNWNKGYDVEGVLGQDVALMLQNALDNSGLRNIRVSVLLNDTMATLLAGSYGPSTQSVLVGVMLGTSTNAVYQQRIEDIPIKNFPSRFQLDREWVKNWDNMEYSKSDKQKTMIVNTEWGAFGELSGDLDAVKTEFDVKVDRQSMNEGKDTLTKLMCGMYTGEITRLILHKLHKEGYLLPDREQEFLGESGMWKMTHFHMANIETDRGITFSSTKKTLAELGIEPADMDACRTIKKVCEAVTERSARLAGAGIAAIIRRIPRETVTVAIDGSLLRYHPTYKKRLEESIDTMLKQRPSTLVARQSFTLKLITDGAVVGAGIAAACFHRDANGNNASDQGISLLWPSWVFLGPPLHQSCSSRI